MIRITDTIELDISFSEPLLVTYKVDLPSLLDNRPRTFEDISKLSFYLSAPDGKTLFPMDNIFPKDVLFYLTDQVQEALINANLISRSPS